MQSVSAPAAPENRLLLIDGLNIVRRVYEAIPGDDTPAKADGALKSSWASILRAISETRPTHFLAAFDHGGPTWRHEVYPEYKADRTPMPQVLRDALPAFLARMDAAGLKTMSAPGVEAEDTITSLGLKAKARRFTVVVASTDKDVLWLIEQGIEVRDHFTSVYRDEAYVQLKHAVPSRLMVDLLALMGDDTDGIPGVKGVGPITAAKLLNEHGSLDAVLAAAEPDPLTGLSLIKGAVGEKLRVHADMARLSRQLATLKTDVKMNFSPNDIRLPPSVSEMISERDEREAKSKKIRPGKGFLSAVANANAMAAVIVATTGAAAVSAATPEVSAPAAPVAVASEVAVAIRAPNVHADHNDTPRVAALFAAPALAPAPHAKLQDPVIDAFMVKVHAAAASASAAALSGRQRARP